VNLPPPLAKFWSRAEPVLHADKRLIGVLAAGSAISGEMDEYSDLDLVLVVRDHDYDAVFADRALYPARIPGLISSFVGYHVGEPRLVITLFEDPLVHVDFKFVKIDSLDDRIETPAPLIDEAGVLRARLATGIAAWPNRDAQWFEDRFWTWMHYGAVKIARGELFEALGFLADVRKLVLGPLLARRHGRDQREVRRIEALDPEFAARMRATVSGLDRDEAWAALDAAMALYVDLRADTPPPTPHANAERVVRAWIEAQRRL
jgi:predicted nucleotidyltransferase